MKERITTELEASSKEFHAFLHGVWGRVAFALRDSVPATLWFVLVYMSLRFYEFFAVRERVEGASGYVFFGWLFDLGFLLSLGLIVLPFHLLFAFAGRGAAAVARAVIFCLILLGGYALKRYFAETFIPLGADLFGYSLGELKHIVGSSGGFSVGTLLPPLGYLALLIAGLWAIQKWKVGEKIPPYGAAAVGGAMFVALFLPHSPNPERYERDVERDLASNKTQRFLAMTASYFYHKLDMRGIPKETPSTKPGALPGSSVHSSPLEQLPPPTDPQYPFLREVKYRDVIGRYFNTLPEGQYPNIVFVLIEGLGRDFAGPNAKYGGFTPYLDALASKSLYWENCLSNGGRTFAVLPSILGSLPYAGRGMQDRGSKMPAHQTLIGLLKPYGYTTHFFYGSTQGFDSKDIFLEYHGADTYLNENNFPDGYSKMAPNDEGFSWGYADREVFSVGLGMLPQNTTAPRLDIYLTSSTHEPFIPPDPGFNELFDQRLAKLKPSSSQSRVYRANKGVFSTILYTDDSVRRLIEGYSKRDDFNRTLFIITGDHRLAPIPIDEQISRFHVPLILYSPMVKTPRTFRGLAVHSNIPPTITGWLAAHFGMKFPEKMPFISGPISTSAVFSSNLDLALIRNKNQLLEYVEGEYMLTDGRLMRITPNLELAAAGDAGRKQRLTQKLNNFTDRATYALDNNKLDKPERVVKIAQFEFTDAEREYLRLHTEGLSPDGQLRLGRDLMRAKKYGESRTVFRNLLNESPNYSDARLLLARNHAYNGEYDTARALIKQVFDRSPGNSQGYITLCDVEYYEGRKNEALAAAREGLKHNPGHADLMAHEARALYRLDKLKEAKAVVEKTLAIEPDNELATELRRKLR